MIDQRQVMEVRQCQASGSKAAREFSITLETDRGRMLLRIAEPTALALFNRLKDLHPELAKAVP